MGIGRRFLVKGIGERSNGPGALVRKGEQEERPLRTCHLDISLSALYIS